MNALQKEITNTFFQTLEDLKTKENFRIFFSDFLSEKELEKFTKRLAIAYWLKKKRDNKNIMQNLHTSLTDVKKIEKIMDTPGIKLALKMMEAEEWANVWSKKINKVVKY